jgi:hypothetical protein
VDEVAHSSHARSYVRESGGAIVGIETNGAKNTLGKGDEYERIVIVHVSRFDTIDSFKKWKLIHGTFLLGSE